MSHTLKACDDAICRGTCQSRGRRDDALLRITSKAPNLLLALLNRVKEIVRLESQPLYSLCPSRHLHKKLISSFVTPIKKQQVYSFILNLLSVVDVEQRNLKRRDYVISLWWMQYSYLFLYLSNNFGNKDRRNYYLFVNFQITSKEYSVRTKNESTRTWPARTNTNRKRTYIGDAEHLFYWRFAKLRLIWLVNSELKLRLQNNESASNWRFKHFLHETWKKEKWW